MAAILIKIFSHSIYQAECRKITSAEFVLALANGTFEVKFVGEYHMAFAVDSCDLMKFIKYKNNFILVLVNINFGEVSQCHE